MHDLGFTHTELGAAGWLPDDRDRLQAVLGQHELSLLAAFIPLVLHDGAQADQALVGAEKAAQLLAAGGARYFNTAPVTSADWKPRHELSGAEWDHLYQMLAEVETICAGNGLTQVVHEHVGCVVETAAEVKAVLENTEVALVLDTGHLAIGGFDPSEVVSSYPDRIGLVHLKDTNLEVAERLNRHELTLMEAVQQGLFTALGQGDLDLTSVVTGLEHAGYQGWYVIEQDCAILGQPPEPGDGPVRDVEVSLNFLEKIAATL